MLALLDAFAPGLPRLRGWMPSPLYRLVHRLRILGFHLGNLVSPGGASRFGYVASRAERLLGRRRSRHDPGESAPSIFRRALASYRPGRYAGAIVLFRAARLPFGIEPADDMGWRGLADEVEIEIVPGYFTTPISEPGVRVLAERLSRRLAAVGADAGRRLTPEVSRAAGSCSRQ